MDSAEGFDTTGRGSDGNFGSGLSGDGFGGGGSGLGDFATMGGGSMEAGSPTESKEVTRQLAMELSDEEEELWRQLRRKRDFELRLLEKRAQLTELRDRRRALSTQHAEVLASVDYLKSELAFAIEQEREIEHDIAMLKESNRILQHAVSQQQLQTHSRPGSAPALQNFENRNARELLAEEKKRQETAQLQHEQIDHFRAHLEKLRVEKAKLQQRQQVLFDKQRSAEQDRNRLLGTLQDDRSKINEVRLDRIKLWEERTKLEREMAQIVRDTQASSTALPSEARPFDGLVGAQGGVRGGVVQDTPQVFADDSSRTQMTVAAVGTGTSLNSGTRANWTGFGDAVGGTKQGSSTLPEYSPAFGVPGAV